MQLRFDGKTAIVTGGASGIGFGVACALAASGAAVVLWAWLALDFFGVRAPLFAVVGGFLERPLPIGALSFPPGHVLGFGLALWASVVGVADFLQTDDLFQMAKPRALPELPNFKQLQVPGWPCGHETVAAPDADGALVSGHAAAAPAREAPR